MLSILSCVCWPSVCLLWRNVCLGLLPFFWLGVCFFDIELHELLINFGDQSFVSCFICKYYLPLWGLSFHLVCSLTPVLDQLSCNHFNFITCQLGPSRNLCCRAVLQTNGLGFLLCVSTVQASCCVRAYSVCCVRIIELPLVHCCSIIDAKLLMDASFVCECACVHYHLFIWERVWTVRSTRPGQNNWSNLLS